MTRYFDRTQMLEYQKCPRSWWYSWGIYGTGIQRVGDDLDLNTGIAVHKGFAALLQGEAGQVAALSCLPPLPEEENARYTGLEQMALVQALVYGLDKVILPQLDGAKILAVELEGEYKGLGVPFLGRPDAVIEHEARELVISLKTKKEWGFKDESECAHDDQGISELLVAEAMGFKPEGVQMVIALKGKRQEWPKGSGRKVQWSPLIRGYRRDEIDGPKYRSRYKWYGPELNEHGYPQEHTLPKSWRRVDMWAPGEMGILCWIDWLYANDRALLEQQFVMPVPIWRRAREVESWIRQRRRTLEEMDEFSGHLEEVRLKHPDRYLDQLDLHFEQRRRQCDWPTRCAYNGQGTENGICWCSTDPADPLAAAPDLYQIRVPHHSRPEESNG